jgi:hypothetical protein
MKRSLEAVEKKKENESTHYFSDKNILFFSFDGSIMM